MTQSAPQTGDQSSVSQPARPGEALRSWALWPLLVLLTAFALSGAGSVPFHPDESTQLFMSRDFELLLSRPLSLAWTPDQAGDGRAHLRLVDAPLTKYLLGLGRSLAGLPALTSDWDWTKTWGQNQAAGALPDPRLLLAGRLTLILLLPFSLLLIYQIGARMHGVFTGLLAVLLMGLNALVLLHDRRAMAEAALTFGVLFAIWSFLSANRHPWLVGLGLAVAFNAKQTGLVLLPVGLLAVALPGLENQPAQSPRWLRTFGACFQMLVVFGLVTFLLNPFLWRQPIQAAQAAIAERQELQVKQTADLKRLLPEVALDSPSRRLAALLANLYFAPPAFAEAANYSPQTRAAEQAYLANPAHHLLRGLSGGGLIFALNLVGFGLACLRLRDTVPQRRQALTILLLTSLCLAIGLFYLAPLPWQRYVTPLVPLTCLWTAYAVTGFWKRPT
jgi:Dolichyl-phosphate-mannose-protein mannosyltransferase